MVGVIVGYCHQPYIIHRVPGISESDRDQPTTANSTGVHEHEAVLVRQQGHAGAESPNLKDAFDHWERTENPGT